jgi:hypothetical protein
MYNRIPEPNLIVLYLITTAIEAITIQIRGKYPSSYISRFRFIQYVVPSILTLTVVTLTLAKITHLSMVSTEFRTDKAYPPGLMLSSPFTFQVARNRFCGTWQGLERRSKPDQAQIRY